MGNGLEPKKHTEQDADDIKQVSNQGNSGICYAHAVATAICETENRIIGRTKTAHSKIVTEITDKFHKVNDLAPVLEWECNKRNLKWKQIFTTSSISNVVNKNRVIVAAFWLTETGWDNFSQFFHDYSPDWVIERSDIIKVSNGTYDNNKYNKFKKSNNNEKTIGHAVVITGYGYGSKGVYWKIKNSWGDKFGDGGYFRIMPDALGAMKYYDVYFRICDLTVSDREGYKNCEEFVRLVKDYQQNVNIKNRYYSFNNEPAMLRMCIGAMMNGTALKYNDAQWNQFTSIEYVSKTCYGVNSVGCVIL